MYLEVDRRETQGGGYNVLINQSLNVTIECHNSQAQNPFIMDIIENQHCSRRGMCNLSIYIYIYVFLDHSVATF